MAELTVDGDILKRLLEWAEVESVPHFKRNHARDGLFSAERYLDSHTKEDKDRLFLLSLDVTFWFWMDDRVDEHLRAGSSLVDWDRLLATVMEDTAAGSTTAEGRFLGRLGMKLAECAKSKEDYDWWKVSAAESLKGFRREESAARGQPLPSLVEYLESGAWSMPLANITATASLLYDMNVARRRHDPQFASIERYLCLFARLENDLHSFEKERREKSPTNSVLLMEQVMPLGVARDFVLTQKQGYRSLLDHGLETLPPEDKFVRFVKALLLAHEQWYGQRPERYESSGQPT
jgi:hypothetical protein